MKRILITGANSYVGTSFEKWMKQFDNYQIDTLDMLDANWREKDFSPYDVVFHVAGLAHADITSVSKEIQDKYYHVNCDLAIETAQKAKRDGVKQFIFMSSMTEAETPQSLSRLERKMVSMDKSSIFRALTLFLEHDVVHAFEDGKGILNYELCEEEGKCDHHDGHIHFYCETCERSFCMEDIHIPSFQLPEGFFPHSVSFVIKGECPECRNKHQHHLQ